MPETAPGLSIIIVSYNTRDLLAECLRSVVETVAAAQTEIWVVDNGSADGSPELVAGRFPAVQLIRNSANLGFAVANNQALKMARGRHFLLLNSDAQLIGDCCLAMQAAFATDPQLGIVGPCLLNRDGSLQPSWGKFPNPLSEFLFQSFLFKVWPAGIPYGRRVHPLERAAYRRFQYVDWVTGAVLMLRREVYEALGGLPEDTFMYAEDLEYCWRAGQAGFHVAYCPTAQAHHVGQAAGRQDYARWIESYTRGLLAYYARHYPSADWRRAAYLIWAGSLLRRGLWRFAALRPSRRQEVAARIAGYSKAMVLAWQALHAQAESAPGQP